MNGITIEVRALTHRYDHTVVLDQVDLHIAGGSRHAIIGANGAGKTTLLGLLTGTGKPASGQILFDGRDVTRLPLHRRAQLGMGRTWQHPALIDSLTAVDNIALALRGSRLPAARRVAAQQLQEAGIAGQCLAARLPYGQRRTLELLVALAPRPRLIVLDEPSAGLDDHEIADLRERLRSVGPDTTVVFTDHHHQLVTAVADTVTVLEHGRHITTGPPAVVVPEPPAAPSIARSPGQRPRLATRGQAARPDTMPALQLTDLTAGYQDRRVLRAVHLQLRAGEVVAVAGTDGAGRTTLINAVAGTLPVRPPSRILMAGIDITRLSPARRAHTGLGTVPQHRMPVPSVTVADQLRLAGADPAQVAAAAHLASWLSDRAHQRVATLSGGERQILAVVCATAREPAVLLLDEAAEGLAPPLITALRQLTRSIAAAGSAVLLTDHAGGPMLAAADRVLTLHQGRLEG